MRRHDRELKQEDALKIIDESVYAVISCADENGEILSLPLSIVRDEMSIFIHGAKIGSKAKLFKDGKECQIVAVSYAKVPNLDDEAFHAICEDAGKLGKYAFTTEYRSAIAKAKAFIVENNEQKLYALRLLSQKYCPQYMSAFDAATPPKVMNAMNIYEFKIYELSAKAKKI